MEWSVRVTLPTVKVSNNLTCPFNSKIDNRSSINIISILRQNYYAFSVFLLTELYNPPPVCMFRSQPPTFLRRRGDVPPPPITVGGDWPTYFFLSLIWLSKKNVCSLFIPLSCIGKHTQIRINEIVTEKLYLMRQSMLHISKFSPIIIWWWERISITDLFPQIPITYLRPKVKK